MKNMFKAIRKRHCRVEMDVMLKIFMLSA